MKLNAHKPDFAIQARTQNLEWLSKSDTESSQNEASSWVHLLELPSPYSFDEALLLCQISEDEWVAWIPDHGEALLHTGQFCQIN